MRFHAPIAAAALALIALVGCSSTTVGNARPLCGTGTGANSQEIATRRELGPSVRSWEEENHRERASRMGDVEWT